MQTNETIAAIASGLTKSGIGIIRISGPEAFALSEELLCLKKGSLEGLDHQIKYGNVRYKGQLIDEVIALIMKGPKSYTGEDTVELQCHGGPYIMKRLLDVVIASGARLAQPGEFTRRAFLNGRIDLSQAEAVMDLIGSEGEAARQAALCGLKGELGKGVREFRKSLIHECAYLEAALDDPEHLSLEGFCDRMSELAGQIISGLDQLIKRADEGRIIREGIKTVILGRPNAGKSTLLNLFSGQERAIVTAIPGTTRDTLEESVRIGDLTLVLTDTAGLREASDEVEKIGVNRAMEAAGQADLILYVIDGTKKDITEDISKISAVSDKIVIILINKADEKQAYTKAEYEGRLGREAILFSAKTGLGREELEDKINKLFYQDKLGDSREGAIANARQKQALLEARQALKNVLETIELGMPEDLLTVDLMSAYSALGNITGEEVNEDLVNEIFSSFCMGK